jgi:hypothetical protein
VVAALALVMHAAQVLAVVVDRTGKQCVATSTLVEASCVVCAT